MNPRERVLTAVDGKEIYPVPLDVNDHIIYPNLEQDLCRHFGLNEDDHEGVLSALGAELRRGTPQYIGPPLEEAPFQPPCAFPHPKATRNIWGSWTGMNTYSDEIDRPITFRKIQ